MWGCKRVADVELEKGRAYRMGAWGVVPWSQELYLRELVDKALISG